YQSERCGSSTRASGGLPGMPRYRPVLSGRSRGNPSTHRFAARGRPAARGPRGALPPPRPPAARWTRRRPIEYLLGPGEPGGRDGEAERLSGEQIDDEIEFCRLLDWDVGRLGPTQNLVDITSRTPVQI